MVAECTVFLRRYRKIFLKETGSNNVGMSSRLMCESLKPKALELTRKIYSRGVKRF